MFSITLTGSLISAGIEPRERKAEYFRLGMFRRREGEREARMEGSEALTEEVKGR